jgi:WhiB family redox-sensing transcriptional regulator
MNLVPEPQPWAAHAACRGANPDLFFPPKGGPATPAKAYCARCPVRPECLDYAITAGETHGIWGGLAERERRQVRAARGYRNESYVRRGGGAA